MLKNVFFGGIEQVCLIFLYFNLNIYSSLRDGEYDIWKILILVKSTSIRLNACVEKLDLIKYLN